MENSSLDLSYQIAIRSYDVLVQRITAMDQRIQSLVALSCAITAAIPILVRNSFLVKNTCLMALLAALFIATISIGLYALVFLKNITDLDPRTFHRHYVNLPEEKFKQSVLEYAGKHYQKNSELLRSKWVCSGWISALICSETLLIVIWAWLPKKNSSRVF